MNKDTMTSFISLRQIAESVDMSVGGVTAAIKRLEEAGDVEKIKEGKNKNGYKFNPHSEKFEMYDLNFLDNKELNPLQKSYYMIVQPYLYVDKESGIGKTTYGDKEISELTGISKAVAQQRRVELEQLGFINRRLTINKNGNSCEALEFNLPKFGQYVLCALEKHEEDIELLKQNYLKMQEEYARVSMELNKMKSIIKLTTSNLLDVEEPQIILE